MTNNQAIGYMILAAKDMGMNEDEIKQLEAGMKYQMDRKTEEQAERVYNNF